MTSSAKAESITTKSDGLRGDLSKGAGYARIAWSKSRALFVWSVCCLIVDFAGNNDFHGAQP
jgi:hypothetical protein